MTILLVATDSVRYPEPGEQSIRGMYPHLGINYLHTILTRKGYNVKVLDTAMAFALSNFESPVNIADQVRKLLGHSDVDTLGISVLTPFRKMAFDIARFAKIDNPKIRIILGGPHVSIMGDLILHRYPSLIDAIVIGEGEGTVPEVIEAFGGKRQLSTVKGIAYVDANGQVIRSPDRPLIEDLDTIPLPTYDHYVAVFPGRKVPTVALLTSRGCPYSCNFCSSSLLWGPRRARSADNVVKEIEHSVGNYGVEEIRIWDDTFGCDREQALGIFRALVESKINVRIGYLNTRFDVMDAELLYWFKKAGGTGMFYGLESGSEKLRQHMNKRFTNARVREVANLTKNLGLRIGLFLIFGYPGETPADVKETYELVKEIRPDQVLCNLANIYPGTRLFEQAKDEQRVRFDDWLEEEPMYFPCSNNDEVKGYIHLFNKSFNGGTAIRTEFENIVYNYFGHDASCPRRVKRKPTKTYRKGSLPQGVEMLE